MTILISIFFSISGKKENWILYFFFVFFFFLFLFHSTPSITTTIIRIPTMIPHIPTPIPRIPRLIPRIPTLISRVLTLILRFPIFLPIPFPDSPFRLLQIACKRCVFPLCCDVSLSSSF